MGMDTDQEIAAYLIKEGRLKAEDLEDAQRLSVETAQRLRRVIVQMGLVLEDDVAEALAAVHGIEVCDIASYAPEPETVLLLPEDVATRRNAIAIACDGRTLTVAMENPFDIDAIEECEHSTGYRVDAILGRGGAILRKLGEYHDHYRRALVSRLLAEVAEPGIELARRLGLEIESLDEIAKEESDAVRAVHLLILQALMDRASDIHIEPMSAALRVRYRIDGVLHEVNKIPWSLAPAVLSRIKVMSQLNIAERRLPQDGHFHLKIENRAIDFRVSIMPTVVAEKAVIRILDRSSATTSLEILGFSPDILRTIRKLLRYPHGIFLVSGPTGSGKTTTLYGALESLGSRLVNITTVEDPVEYQVDGVTQIQVHPKIGLTFANALRSVLRQDPDVIFVGEIRDPETAQIAVRAALTGHLVLATVHTNDAATAVARLLDMEIEPYLIASALRGVLGQRLVRNLCRNCLTPARLSSERLSEVGFTDEEGASLVRGIGCPHCFGTGYRGRSAIAELLIPGAEIQELITTRRPATEIRQAAIARGFRTIREDGLRAVLAHETTLDEVLAVTEEIERPA
jgi:type II secretory ATPase GspE/PulE/Tfp pilus assembly ATPase PilB-like protein